MFRSLIYCFLLTLFCAVPSSLTAEENTDKKPAKVLWIAHRGECFDAPENTIPAFKLALDRNADGFECDVRLSSDGKLVISHDATTKRTGNADRIISQSTYKDLQTVDVSNKKKGFKDTKIPLFTDVLKILGKRICFVEIKSAEPSILTETVKCIDNAGIPAEQVILISFNANIIKKYKELYPDRKALWITGFRAFDNGTWKYTADELIEKLKSINADGVSIQANMQFLNASYIQKVKNAGFSFSVWTVDRGDLAKKMIDMGVDSITSNRATILKQNLSK